MKSELKGTVRSTESSINEKPNKPCNTIHILTGQNRAHLEKDIIGYLDKISKTSVFGWASFLNSCTEHSKCDATPVEVKLFVNNKIVKSKLAENFRKDIKTKGIHPTGNCGFHFKLNGDKVFNQNDKISIKAGKENIELKGSPKIFDSEEIIELHPKISENESHYSLKRVFTRVKSNISRIKRLPFIGDKLLKQFSKYKWITKFVIHGKEYGGWYDPSNDRRLKHFSKAFPHCSTILELGSFEGGHTINLIRLPNVTKVVGLEGREYNVEKANFIKKLLKVDNIEFILSDLEKETFEQYGQFDAVFSVGFLYHLSEPWKHLKAVRNVSENLFICTRFVSDEKADQSINTYHGWKYQESGYQDPLSGLSEQSFWPTLKSLTQMLNDAGFSKVEIIEIGRLVTISAKAR